MKRIFKTKNRYIFALLINLLGITGALSLGKIIKVARWSDNTARRGDLQIRWEGVIGPINYNFRDLGKSINDCLGQSLFQQNLVFRANAKFSGWECSRVDNPDILLSLNFDPLGGRKEYFCIKEDGKPNVGLHFNREEVLSDLEFLSTWDESSQLQGICAFILRGYGEIADSHRVLIHCDAGRDRTGAYSALLVALAAESMHKLDDNMLAAIECDYRKTASLTEDKYQRMEHFIRQVRADYGSIAGFLERKCQVPQTLLERAAEAFSWKGSGKSP